MVPPQGLHHQDSPMRTVREKEKKPQPSIRTLPAFIGLFVVVMVVTAIIRSRGSRGTCVYDHVYRKVTCKIKELRIIPSDIGDGVITLHMGSKLDKQENYFTVLQSENFTTKFRHVHELRLIKCGIEEIRPEAFIKLTSLRRLDLRYNRIHVINEEMFRGVSQLEYLYLSNNPIERLGEFVFRGLFIDNLVLANNPALIEISNKVFAGAVIKSLVMNRCSITTIKVDTFTHIAESLKELYITHNMQPLVLPETIFQGIRLDKLTLSSNGLTDTEFLEGLISKEINLDDNPLIEFDCDDCSSLRETRRLTLTKTKLTHLTKEDFSSLTGLRDLDLDGNDLTVFNASIFTTMTMLKFLDLSNNDIEDFDGNFTDLFPELATLALEFNDIQTLPRELEPIFSRLDNLTLYGNPLHCNCELRWLAKWLEKPRYRQIMQNLDEIMCETPESSNFTHVSDYGFQCREPTIFNATFDSDGISLLCTADGDPAPTVTWISPDDTRKSTIPDRWERDLFQTRSSLTISKDGNYTCVAHNLAGEDRVTVNTRKMPTSGLRFHVESQEIEILETPQGFAIITILIAILGYLVRK